MKFRVLLIAAGMALLGANAANATAIASTTTFNFSGVCAANDCTGTGNGTLVVQNYTLGTAFDNTNFVSWSYSSDKVTYSLSQGQESALRGSLGATPGEYHVIIASVLYDFSSTSQGNWNVDRNLVNDDTGPTSLWTEVPEPLTLSLFGAGLAGMTALRRRKKAAA